MDYVARTPEQLGQILRSCRKRRGLTQQQAAARVGLKQGTVSAAETEGSGTSMESLYKILSALGLELVVRDPEESAKTRSTKPEW